MIVKPCPKCGRKPKITECIRLNNGTKRYMIYCPNYCAVLKEPSMNGFTPNVFHLYDGNGDNNTIYKEWNNLLLDSN